MRLVEQLRNQIEIHPLLGIPHDIIGHLPPYRSLVLSRARKRIDHVRATRGYSVLLEVSSLCNARCSFCPNRTLERSRGVMSDATFDVAVGRMVAEDIRPPSIDLFLLGEPLLDPHLFARVRRLKAAFPGAWIRTTSNFALATDDTITEILASGLDSIHISLNATRPETYRALMGLDYQPTVEIIERLLARRDPKNHQPHILLSMVLGPDNVGEARQFVRTWERRVDSLRIQRAISWSGSVDVHPPYRSWKRRYPCRDLFERIPILSDGTMALCCADPEGMRDVSIHDRSILDAFYSESFERVRSRHLAMDIKGLPMCRDCFGANTNGAEWLFAKSH